MNLSLGRVVATPGALNTLEDSAQSPTEFLARHRAGDWGTVSPDDWKINDEAAIGGDRILSAYLTAKGEKLWVITEYDRSVTTILRPDEY